VVVKEEYAGSACDDADLNGWRVMRKEAPGFDPVDGDWHWQWVNADRTVRFDDKQTCVGCHARPACLAATHVHGTAAATRRAHHCPARLPAASSNRRHRGDRWRPSGPTRPIRPVPTSCTTTVNDGTG
jgi:hypothetical protein